MLCAFGDDLDREAVANELKSVLTGAKQSNMDKIELQKSVDAVFMALQILQHWGENEIEERYKVQRSGKQSKSRPSTNSRASSESSVWPPDETVTAIENLLSFISFDLCAKAAAHVGMPAQSLRFLEMEARKLEAELIFDSIGQNDGDRGGNKSLNSRQLLKSTHIDRMDIGLAHRLFGELSDRNSMTAIARCREEISVFDQIHERQSYDDWDGVLRLCELASQIKSDSSDISTCNLENARIKALLELGHFDSALKQVTGMIDGDRKGKESSKSAECIVCLLPHAVHASWRLGKWDALDNLVKAP